MPNQSFLRASFVLAALLLAGIPVLATPFVTSASSLTCWTAAGVPCTSSSSANNYASAAVTLTLPDDPSAFSYLQGSGTTNYNAPDLSSGQSGGSVTGSLTFSQALTTTGSSRLGFVQIVLSGSGSNNGGYALGTTTIPTATNFSGFPFINAVCGASPSYGPGSDCNGAQGYFNHLGLIPFNLGQGFTLSYVESGYAMSDSAGVGGNAGFLMDYGFRFFESDGTTPVEVIATPEPSSFGFACLFGGLAFLKRLRPVRRRRGRARRRAAR